MNEVEALLQKQGPLTVEDFALAWEGTPMPTVYSRIRALLLAGQLSEAGRGVYEAIHKPKYEILISDWMREVNNWMLKDCEGINCCICEQSGNLHVDVAKCDTPTVLESMRKHYTKVVLQKDASLFPSILEGYIIIGSLVTDAPITEMDGVPLPTLEKSLVDSLTKHGNNANRQFSFQKAMEIYPVNINRMKRYAARRGVKEELIASLNSLDTMRIDLFSATQKYLASIPVTRAWVFGSFARGEETPDSDLDILVDYDESAKVSLLDIVGYQIGLEKIIGRQVDFIQNGSLKPFAVPSAEREKYLIYER